MYKSIYTYLICCLVTTGVAAQVTDTIPAAPPADTTATVSKIEVDEVEVIKAFEVKLGEAKRIGLGPKPQPTKPVVNSYDYDITIVPAEISYADPVIKPLAMSPDAKANVDHLYTKLGYGNTASPYGDLSFYKQTPEVYDVLLDVHHFSFDNTDKVLHQKMAETNINLDGSYLLGENTLLSLQSWADLESRNLYDTTDVLFVSDDAGRKLGRYGAKIGAASAEPTATGLRYRADIGANYTDYSGVAELAPTNNELLLMGGGEVSQKINNQLTSYVKADVTLADLTTGSDSKSLLTIDANAGLRYQAGILNVDAAADVVYSDAGTKVFADAELAVAVDKSMQVFVGVDQEALQHNLSTTYDRNPFVQLDSTILQNTVIQRYYAGIRGKVLQRLTFSLSGGYEDIADQYYYTANADQPTLTQQYQDATNIAIDATIEFALNQIVSIGGHVNQNFYDLAVTDELLNVTASEFSIYSRLSLLSDKLRLMADLTVLEAVPFLTNGLADGGDAMYDVSVEAQYFLLKNIAIWARGSNLLDNNYLMHAGYPTVGLQAHGGVMVKF